MRRLRFELIRKTKWNSLKQICKGQTKWCVDEWNGRLLCFGFLMMVGFDTRRKVLKILAFESPSLGGNHLLEKLDGPVERRIFGLRVEAPACAWCAPPLLGCVILNNSANSPYFSVVICKLIR